MCWSNPFRSCGLWEISFDSRKIQAFQPVSTFLALCRLRSTVLCASLVLSICNPILPTYKDSILPSESLPQLLLSPLVVRAREMFREAFEKPFFWRLKWNSPSLCFRNAGVFHAAFISLRCFKSKPSCRASQEEAENYFQCYQEQKYGGQNS